MEEFEEIVKLFKLAEYIDEIKAEEHLDIPEIKLSTKLSSTTSAVPLYTMKTKNRGVLFFINIRHFLHYPQNPVRLGSEHDKFYMISLFRKFGFKIFYYEDVTLEIFNDLVHRLVKYHLNDVESLFFVVASHGDVMDHIHFTNDRVALISHIIYKFNNLDCPQMKGKPKIFVFPLCRGQKKDYYSIVHANSAVIKKPTYSDILICYATVHGFATIRDVNFGSCYIEAFYRVLAERAHELDFESMLYLINDKVAEICSLIVKNNRCRDPAHPIFFQTPSCVRRDFNKLLFLNPGYFEDDSEK